MSAATGDGGGSERRTQRRVTAGLSIIVRGSDAAGHRYEESATSFDLSRTGLSFVTTREIAVGDELEIFIPQGGAFRKLGREFSTLAQVVRVQKDESDKGKIVGVQFLGRHLNRVFVSETTT
ncbi:MAG: PilZ domain-containing protein [Candidatus Acidiferrales bacterium]